MIPGDAGPADCIVNAIKFLPSGLSSSGVVGCGCGEGCGSNIVILELKSYQNIKTNKRALGTLFPWVCGSNEKIFCQNGTQPGGPTLRVSIPWAVKYFMTGQLGSLWPFG